MVYADTDFFLALLKPNDWLKERAARLYLEYQDNIETSLITFLEIMLIAKKFNLPPIQTTAALIKITHYDDPIPLTAAKYIEDGVGVFDAFHAAQCVGKILSSNRIYDKLGIERIAIENQTMDKSSKKGT
jgi:predicted nucleic acid-binding protein